MQVVALPGRRSETEAWLRSLLLAAELSVDGIVRYQHWERKVEANVEFEASRLAGLAPQLVVAKSMGTIVAAAAHHFHGFRPRSAILIGTPYGALPSPERRLLQKFAQSITTLFVQQTADPGGSAEALAATLQLTGAEVIAVPGSDHLYSDTHALGAILTQWKHIHQ